MSPRRPRGRRPKAWTHQQKRRLARLYTLTTLSNAEILAVLAGEDFHSSERHALTKLRELYSKEYIEDLHELRPRSEVIMRSRLNVLQHSPSCRISKVARYSRLKIRSKTGLSQPHNENSDIGHESRDLRGQLFGSRGPVSKECFNPSQPHHGPITPDLQIALSQCTLPDSQYTTSSFLMLDGSVSSKKTLLTLPKPGIPRQNCPVCLQPTCKVGEKAEELDCGHVYHLGCLSTLLQQHSLSSQVVCLACNVVLKLHPNSWIDPRTLILASNPEDMYDTVISQVIPTNASITSKPFDQGEEFRPNSSRDPSYLMGQQKMKDEIEDIGQRLRNRSSSYIEHVNSVVRLSLSESSRTSCSLSVVPSSLEWTVSSRSSWMSMSSISTNTESVLTSLPDPGDRPLQGQQGLLYSGRRIFYKVAGPLIRGERDIWNEIIDEGQLLPAPESRPIYRQMDFFDRACSGTLDPFDNLCSRCGYSMGWYHWHPNNGNYRDIDNLGNTKLHYAAASDGSTLSLSMFQLLVNQGVDIAARNSSGQTFMHVLKTKQFISNSGFNDLRGYIELLEFLSKLDFPFSQRDFHGRTIAHLIFMDGVLVPDNVTAKVTECLVSQLFEILQILDTDMNILDNHGFNAGDEILRHLLNAKLPGPNIEQAAQNVLRCFKRHGLLQTNFRESFARLEWTPTMWIKWLWEGQLVDWIDVHGDTPLTALLKNRRSEDQQATLEKLIPKLVHLGVDVNMRDRKGHTAISIAAIRGSLSSVQALLDCGANVNVVNYHGRDIVSMASWRMKMAKQEGKIQCYARIMACVNLIADVQLKETRP